MPSVLIDHPAFENAARLLQEGYYHRAKDAFVHLLKNRPRLKGEITLAYEKTIQQKPQDISLRLSLADFFISLMDFPLAQIELEEILDLSPKNIEAYNTLGRLMIMQKRTRDAILLLERALKKNIKDIILTEMLASAYLKEENLSQAVKLYEEVLKYDPNNKRVLRILGDLYARLLRYEESARMYSAMFSDDPQVVREVTLRLEDLKQKEENSILIRELLAEVYLKSLKPDKASVEYRAILAIDPKKISDLLSKYKAILKTYPDHPETVIALAEGLVMQNEFSEAVEAYSKLLQRRQEFADMVIKGYQKILEKCPQQVMALQYLGEAFLLKGNYHEALNTFRYLIKIDPSSADYVFKKVREVLKSSPNLILAKLAEGEAFIAKGDYSSAISRAEEIISIDKKNAEAYVLLGDAFSLSKISRKAKDAFLQALKIDPFNEKIHQKYRTVKEKETLMEIESLNKKSEEDVWRFSLHLDLAKLYLKIFDRDKAIKELQTALKDASRAPFALQLLGDVFASQGKYHLAAAQYEKALQKVPPELAEFGRRAKFNLGMVFEAQGLLMKAAAIYEEILQEDIDFCNLKEKLKHLKSSKLFNIRNKKIICCLEEYGRKNVIGLWGRDLIYNRYEKDKDFDVSFGQSHNNSGFDFFMKGMYEAAKEEFSLSVGMDNKFAAALNNLGTALMREGAFDDAKTKFKAALDIEEDSPVVLNNLALTYFLKEETAKAKELLQRALEQDADLSVVKMNLGDVCYFKGDVEEALSAYKSVKNFDVLSDLAQKRLLYKIPED